MPVVRSDFDATREQPRDLAAELCSEFHAVLLGERRLALVLGTMDKQPQSALAVKPGDEARFRQTMDGHCDWSSPRQLFQILLKRFGSGFRTEKSWYCSGTVPPNDKRRHLTM
jgi:hypothetical protein